VLRWRMMAREIVGRLTSDAKTPAMDFCSIGRSKLEWEFMRPQKASQRAGEIHTAGVKC